MFFGGVSRGLSRVSEAGAPQQEITRPDREQGEKAHRFPVVLPGEKAVIFTLGSRDIESWDEASIALLNLETEEVRVLLEGGMRAQYSPTGHLVYARGGSLLAVPFDSSLLRVTGAPVQVVEGVSMSHVSGSAEFSISREGSLVYAPGRLSGADRRVVWLDRDGRTEPLIETPRTFVDVALSPDDRLLAATIAGANDTIWPWDLSRGTLTRLAAGADNMWPVWAPASDKIAFTSTRDGPFNLFWQSLDAASTAERLAPRAAGMQRAGSWTNDGKTFIFEQAEDLWAVSLDENREPWVLLESEHYEGHPKLSPNGRLLAYISDESGQYEVHLRRFPELVRQRQVSVDGGRSVFWNPNGRELFYQSGSRLMSVAIDERRGMVNLSKPTVLFDREARLSRLSAVPGYELYTVTADGQRFITIEEVRQAPPPTHLILVQNFGAELDRLVPSNP